jgi:acid phosphatase (class A)
MSFSRTLRSSSWVFWVSVSLALCELRQHFSCYRVVHAARAVIDRHFIREADVFGKVDVLDREVQICGRVGGQRYSCSPVCLAVRASVTRESVSNTAHGRQMTDPMRASITIATFAIVVMLCDGPRAAQADSPVGASSMVDRPAPSGYLVLPDVLDMIRVLPPAPRNGDARDVADRRIFRDTRKLLGTPRWDLASFDANLSTRQLLSDFACGLDIELTPEHVPVLTGVLQKAAGDAEQASAKLKDHYQRKRPYWIDKGAICRPRAELGQSLDYPSDHATVGWVWAMVLSQVAPEDATPIFERGRSIGESRIVCGVHNASAVEASRLLANATLTLIMATPEYQADLLLARQELAALRKQAHATPDPARCKIEAKLIAEPVVP